MAEQTANFLIQLLKERNPDIDTRVGTITRDWLITPLSILLEEYEDITENIAARQDISNYETLTDAEMDDLAANLFVYRDLGVRPRAEVVLSFNTPTDVFVQAGSIVESGDGTKRYSFINSFRASADVIGSNPVDSLFNTTPIPVESVNPGSEFTVESNELIYMPFAPLGLARVTNPLASQWGSTRETNADLFSRIPTALSSRQIMNNPGTRGELIRQFRHIKEIFLVGAGDDLMRRDETFSFANNAGSLLPVSSFYGKVRGDSTNKNRASRFATLTTTLPNPASGFLEVSQKEYQGLGSKDDALLSRYDTNVIFEDDFSDRGEFVSVETDLSADADATSEISVDNTAFFEVGDLVELSSDDSMVSDQTRTVLSVGASIISLSANVSGLTTADNSIIRRVKRPSSVGGGWIESSNNMTLGTETAGLQALVEDGDLVFQAVNNVTADEIKDILKEALTDDVDSNIDSLDVSSIVPSNTATSPVVQRPLSQQNGLRIRGQFTTDDDSTGGKIIWITTRRPSTGTASYYAGFGAALRRSVASTTTTTTTAPTSADDATISVSNTASFRSSGSLIISSSVVTYTGKTTNSFTGCTGTPVSTSGSTIAASKNTLFIVDNGNLGTSENAYLAANDTPLLADTNYWFELLITPPSGSSSDEASSTEFRLWRDDTTTVRPVDATLSYGSYIPTAARSGSTSDTHFGISTYNNDEHKWSFNSIKIDSIASVYPHYLFRFNAADFGSRFKVTFTGRAQGEDENGLLARGVSLRLWNASESSWEKLGSHESSSTDTIESTSSGHAISAYRDTSEYVWVLASGDNPWGISYPSFIDVDYVSIFDDGVRGIHVGSKVDVYVRSDGGILSTYQDIDNVDSVVIMNESSGFTLPIASIDSILTLDTNGDPLGGVLTEGIDYDISIPDPSLRYSSHERIALTFSPGIQGSSLRVFYSTFQFIGDIQDFLESSDNRLVAADVLARAFIPSFVTLTIRMTGYTISDEEMRRALADFINNTGTKLKLSDFNTEAIRLGAEEVDESPTVSIERHSLSGDKTNISLTNEIELEDNERFVARSVNVIRT